MCFFNTIVHCEDGEFWAEVPALPGCYAMGKTRDELRDNIREAISGHLAALNEADSDDEDAEIMQVAL